VLCLPILVNLTLLVVLLLRDASRLLVEVKRVKLERRKEKRETKKEE
jgi:hypothetical protein